MIEIKKIHYKCEVCGFESECDESVKRCEKEPIKHERGVKVGDKVMILNGDGQGKMLMVEKVFLMDCEYFGDKHTHSIALRGSIIDSWGGRLLTFENYEVIK